MDDNANDINVEERIKTLRDQLDRTVAATTVNVAMAVETTSSGVVPGQAPLDTPPPNVPEAPPLEHAGQSHKLTSNGQEYRVKRETDKATAESVG
ncbi:hypothetical protein FRC12_014013 [Ceratobasidium sp. 428]|nr:hypothetical protein FRC12_014013 [Ceratobasidium sp. 428]